MNSSQIMESSQVVAALQRAAGRMIELRDELNKLDAALGDGDTGITVSKCAEGIREYLKSHTPDENYGQFFINLGITVNQMASSSLGTLIASALIRAGKESQGVTVLDDATLAHMLRAADAAIRERGNAKPGDKTIVDAMNPAVEAFSNAVAEGKSLADAATEMLQSARAGRDSVIPLKSKIGRASWIGERTQNRPDPGTVLFVQLLEAVLRTPSSEPGSTL